ncbi:putative folylpolyglutamate synthase [Schistocerca gregaria]|uniref:putative folylpolyglutamate synthase n=1 Tax=Schistocerca gregaria TaxID=7010 RepID=UPI00211E09BA|nr:putative folylpolyglutamate synthase [Schistocerca gregaria]
MVNICRDYKSALRALNSLQSNSMALANSKKRLLKENRQQNAANEETMQLCEILGIDIEKLSKRAFHVAGTKGKGSTCSMVESMLRSHGYSTGLYTSPHLVTVRERIRLNGACISEEMFAYYFWLCWDLLEKSRSDYLSNHLNWFFYLTLLALKIFSDKNLDSAIIEVGIGGRIDYTNVLTSPAVCGITLLDYDHTNVLGTTIQEIAQEKAGILKPNTPVVTVEQQPEALKVILQKAKEINSPIFLSHPSVSLYTQSVPSLSDSSLGIKPEFMQRNACLSIALLDVWFQRSPTSKVTHTKCFPQYSLPLDNSLNVPFYPTFTLSSECINGLLTHHWPGRAHIVSMANHPICFYLDGAHTIQSMKLCIEWYSSCTRHLTQLKRILIFNVSKPRDPQALLTPVVQAIQTGLHFSQVYFTKSQLHPSRRKDGSNDLSYEQNTDEAWQVEQTKIWQDLVSFIKQRTGSNLTHQSVSWPSVQSSSTVDEVIGQIIDHSKSQPGVRYEVLVTGSLYLVGAVLELLNYPIDQVYETSDNSRTAKTQ